MQAYDRDVTPMLQLGDEVTEIALAARLRTT